MMETPQFSLPPLVEGPAQGELTLTLGPVCWTSEVHDPQPLKARIAWWGDAIGQVLQLPLPPPPAARGSLPPPTPDDEARLSYRLCTGPTHLARYLRDMGSLTIAVEVAAATCSDDDGEAGPPRAATVPVAVVSVGLMGLLDGGATAPVCGSFPVVALESGASSSTQRNNGGGDIVGSIHVHLELHYFNDGDESSSSYGGSSGDGGVTLEAQRSLVRACLWQPQVQCISLIEQPHAMPRVSFCDCDALVCPRAVNRGGRGAGGCRCDGPGQGGRRSCSSNHYQATCRRSHRSFSCGWRGQCSCAR